MPAEKSLLNRAAVLKATGSDEEVIVKKTRPIPSVSKVLFNAIDELRRENERLRAKIVELELRLEVSDDLVRQLREAPSPEEP